MTIGAKGMDFQALNRAVRACADEEITIENCLGQRYIGDGLDKKHIVIHGVPGNGLGAYLDGARLTVYGNAQDVMGDTMNAGEIVVHGSAGDAVGYGMRGGRILIRDSAGYRVGIHMKAYMERVPVLVIGGCAGSFLGEYQAGGRIVVLGLGFEGQPVVSNFTGTGMHGGAIYLRTQVMPPQLPPQVMMRRADEAEMAAIADDVRAWCAQFGGDAEAILADPFQILLPNTANPYKQLYTHS